MDKREERIRKEREERKELENKGIKYSHRILTCRDERVCPECQKLEGNEYSTMDEVPELPYAKCTNEKNGCRCSYYSDLVF